MADSPLRTVLLVDDEEDILVSLEALFRRDVPGCRVLTAISGDIALELLKREPVHLIITDYRMPGMNGLEFLAQAKKLAPGVPSIMITAFPDPELAARAVNEFGVGLFIAKPFDLTYLLEVVRSLITGPAPQHPAWGRASSSLGPVESSG